MGGIVICGLWVYVGWLGLLIIWGVGDKRVDICGVVWGSGGVGDIIYGKNGKYV